MSDFIAFLHLGLLASIAVGGATVFAGIVGVCWSAFYGRDTQPAANDDPGLNEPWGMVTMVEPIPGRDGWFNVIREGDTDVTGKTVYIHKENKGAHQHAT